MKTLRSFIAFTLILVSTTTSVCGQPPCCDQPICCDQSDVCCPAYEEGSNSAHWSVYIPIAALVGAAIWFGMADNKKDKNNSSNSQDALGSIVSSRRVNAKYSKHSHYFRSKTLPPANKVKTNIGAHSH